ncbi:hypothetical protein [Methanomethylovorans sp.]|uniref:hypothetical protein n=1 Tax=Methanomethylovorans sp. TaxID=2758717 RepID=UPI00345EA0EE
MTVEEERTHEHEKGIVGQIRLIVTAELPVVLDTKPLCIIEPIIWVLQRPNICKSSFRRCRLVYGPVTNNAF